MYRVLVIGWFKKNTSLSRTDLHVRRPVSFGRGMPGRTWPRQVVVAGIYMHDRNVSERKYV